MGIQWGYQESLPHQCAAMQHPQRTTDPTQAEAVLLCPFFYYNSLLDDSPQCDGVSGKIASRTLPAAQA